MTSDAFVISGVRLTHHTASVADLETVSHPDLETRLRNLHDHDSVAEALVLQRCNRVEEYVVAETRSAGREATADFGNDVEEEVIATGHEESLRHLLRVAAGLESQILGEDQVLGQVRDAYSTAESAGTLGSVLEPALLKAIHVGERARTETRINEGRVSLGGAAVHLATTERDLDGVTVLVIGAGEMGKAVVGQLADFEVDLHLANRTPERAADLASTVGVDATYGGLESLADRFPHADVVITSTGSADPVITADDVAEAGEFFVIDLAQPRDVAPSAVDSQDVTIRDLDDLQAVTEKTHEERREAAKAVEAIVAEEFDNLIEQYKRERADAVIAAVYRSADRIKGQEVDRALSRLDGDLDENQREVVAQLADSLVSQLLAVPTKSLRDAAAEEDWETMSTALELFDPDLGDDESESPTVAIPADFSESPSTASED